VAGGPYHRLGQPIYDALTVFKQSPDEAAQALRRAGATYVALCRFGNMPREAGASSFANALLRGPAPAWLEPMTAPDAQVAIFRVARLPPAGEP
jgi:hypothetical protein